MHMNFHFSKEKKKFYKLSKKAQRGELTGTLQRTEI